MQDTALAQESRTKRLKAATHEAHEQLDRFIMRARPFADRVRYGRFLEMQYSSIAISTPYSSTPRLRRCCRISLVEEDLRNIGSSIPNATRSALFVKERPVELAQALV
ncbi:MULTISPECIES: hypothetical protein [Neorhizobium]|uniref:hypothetical protein n=1 Tax=Neorhizobium TaxID=1525371 RepID=UPI000CF88BCE|nr:MULTISPECIES: hypothetical protein [Neorhizobium]